jgi:mediator of RNA polymerase II transcription subunit 14
MENGVQNGTHTNHDRDGPRVNGVNGGFIKSEPGLDKGKAVPDKGKGVNTFNGSYDDTYIKPDSEANTMSAGDAVQNSTAQTGADADAMMKSMRLEELPDEIQHITTGIFPLGLLLSRLAQMTHNHLGDLIDALAELPIAPAPNGVSDSRTTGAPAEDTSPVSLEKKKRILDFIQGEHNKWVKALVLTEWSRKSDQVWMLIDLKGHLEQQLNRYGLALTDLINLKRELVFARVPPPDHKTALHVLSYGDVDWMPEFGYMEPPPVDPDEELELMESLNTLLDARLTLADFDKIPYHFRNYVIEDGRATFRVEGEFEVDLTIADDDFDKQYWFLDFRFTFTPAPEELTAAMRNFLDVRVNDVLATDGLAGCYSFLHEFTLTHKITEIRRQALELAKTRWVGSLTVEPLNRALSIQYWLPRPVSSPQTGLQHSGPQSSLKSWFIIGVHSGRKTGAVLPDPAATSYLSLRWFRDGKEVKDVDFSLDTTDISAEKILKMIVGRHVEHILTSMYNKLASFPRYKNREAPLQLALSNEEPSDSQLVMHLSQKETLVVRIDPMTGLFAVSPMARAVSACERALNTSRRNPAEDGYILLERARWHYSMEELTRHGRSMGWEAQPLRVRNEELKPLVKTRDMYQPLWMRHVGWRPDWHVLVTMGLAGDRWWLIQV